MHICLGTTPTVQLTMTFKHLEIDEVNRAVEVVRGASGKSINVARGLHTLGETVTAVAPVGGDSGAFMKRELAAAGIACKCVDVREETRTCVSVINQSDGTTTELVQEHARLSDDECLKILEQTRELLPGAKMLILSGSQAAGVPDDFYANCCALAKNAGVKVILDARGPAMLKALQHRPMIVKPNRRELAETLGFSPTDEHAMRAGMLEIHRQGAHWVLITMGKNGALLTDGKGFWHNPAIDVKAISPIGSGDAFTAGLAAGISRGQSVPDACRLASACAAANTLVPGSGVFYLNNVHSLAPTAQILRQT